MLEANQDPYDFDLQELAEYLERLETASSIFDRRDHVIKDVNSKKTFKRKADDGNKKQPFIKKNLKLLALFARSFIKATVGSKMAIRTRKFILVIKEKRKRRINSR